MESMSRIYMPNSVNHGFVIPRFSTEVLLKLECERLRDFIEFLFDHSEHCDHISHNEAWDEFTEYELKTHKVVTF